MKFHHHSAVRITKVHITTDVDRTDYGNNDEEVEFGEANYEDKAATSIYDMKEGAGISNFDIKDYKEAMLQVEVMQVGYLDEIFLDFRLEHRGNHKNGIRETGCLTTAVNMFITSKDIKVAKSIFRNQYSQRKSWFYARYSMFGDITE